MECHILLEKQNILEDEESVFVRVYGTQCLHKTTTTYFYHRNFLQNYSLHLL